LISVVSRNLRKISWRSRNLMQDINQKYNLGRILLSWKVKPHLKISKEEIKIRNIFVAIIVIASILYLYFFFLKEVLLFLRILIPSPLVLFLFSIIYQPRYEYIVSENGVYVKHYFKRFYRWKDLDYSVENPSKLLYSSTNGPRSYYTPKTKEIYFVIGKRFGWHNLFSFGQFVDLFVKADDAQQVRTILMSHLRQEKERIVRTENKFGGLGFFLIILILNFIIGFFFFFLSR